MSTPPAQNQLRKITRLPRLSGLSRLLINASPLLLGTAFAAVSNPTPATAQQLAIGYQTIGRNQAARTAIDVEVYPGRATAIDFSQTDEVIIYTLIADPSRVILNTDAQLDSGNAKTLFLRPIQPLDFPGTTTAPITNLIIKTQNPAGVQRIYNFQIVHKLAPLSSLGIQIVPFTATGAKPTLNLGANRTATLDEIEIGLQIAIGKGYTEADDPVVFGVRQFLALIRNQELSIEEAATQAGVELAVLVELGKIAKERFALVVSDISLPVSRPETLPLLREWSKMPVESLSSRERKGDAIRLTP
ncbi:MAG: hypothetical protein F6J89_24910 [Symploca sp. SIO1C4]|uniref:Uncharacterized protein n=1 Tax=Symploca sp. SIO1C4 TaxID=2607765 RepID=A0A6B3NNH3_9CYAN|nr:hypothetical protein [Symploca sp. SIO1C4]